MTDPHLVVWEGGGTTKCRCPIGKLHTWFEKPGHTHDDDSWWAGCPGCGPRRS